MKTEETKIKKKDNLNLDLEKNIDILNHISKHNSLRPKLVIGFAAETKNLEQHAKQKLIDKNLDVIVANNVTEKGAGFSIDTNKVTIIDNKGNTLKLGILPKYEVANQIINKITSMMS